MSTEFEAQFEYFWTTVFHAAFEMAVDVHEMTRAQWAALQADQALAELLARRTQWASRVVP